MVRWLRPKVLRRLPLGWLASLLLGLLGIGCQHRNAELIASAPTVSRTVRDARGQTVSLPAAAQRIVALNPGPAESLRAMGAGDRLLALPDTTTLATVGALDPDLVVLTASQYTPRLAQTLQAQGLAVYVQPDSTLGAIWSGIRDLGTLTDREAAATRLADSLARFEARLRERTKDEFPSRSLWLLLGASPQGVGRRSYLHDLLVAAGGSNALADRPEALLPLPPDSLYRRNPEFILLPADSDEPFRDYVTAYPQLVTLPALAENRVYRLDPALLHPGPQLGQALVTVTRMLHPGVNPE